MSLLPASEYVAPTFTGLVIATGATGVVMLSISGATLPTTRSTVSVTSGLTPSEVVSVSS